MNVAWHSMGLKSHGELKLKNITKTRLYEQYKRIVSIHRRNRKQFIQDVEYKSTNSSWQEKEKETKSNDVRN